MLQCEVTASQNKDIRNMERIQRTATKMVQELLNMTYEDRAKEMDLTALKQKRDRGDMIMLYRLVNKLEEVDRDDLFNCESTRDDKTSEKNLLKELI